MDERQPKASTRWEASYEAGWMRLRERTRSKLVPHLLVAAFYAFGILATVSPSDPWSGAFGLATLAAGASFYGIVIVRLVSARPYGLVTLWFLFIAYAIWLGLLPPLSKRDVADWFAWGAVLVGLAAAISVMIRSAY